MVPLCARCLAIYPAAFLLLILSAVCGFPLHRLDTWGLWLLPAPAVLDAVSDWMGWRRSSPAIRMGTGLMLGVALARLFEQYLANPADPLVWQIVAVYGLPSAVAAVLALRVRRAS